MPSRSMSTSRAFGSVMPGHSRLSSLAVPLVSLMPTPGRFANTCLMRSRRFAMCPWNSGGSRSCQLGRSPPWPSASMTWWPNRPMGNPPLLEAEHAAGELPAAQVVQRTPEVVEGVVLGDELVDLEPATEVQVGQQREVAPRARRAVAAAEDRLVLVERVHHHVEARAELRHTDDGQRPAGSERVERLLDDRQAADRLEGVVGAA